MLSSSFRPSFSPAPCTVVRSLNPDPRATTYRSLRALRLLHFTQAAALLVSPTRCASRARTLSVVPVSVACGKTVSGYTAAMSQLAFGAPPGSGAGDACGRCFSLTGQADPYSSNNHGPFNSIIVKVTDLCPVQGNEKWCGQTKSNQTNSFGQSVQCAFFSPSFPFSFAAMG